jgi:predicted ATPase
VGLGPMTWDIMATGLAPEAAAMLEHLRLTDFKNFRRAELPLGPLTLLVGTNASGKSNLRDAFRFLHGISRGYTLAEIIGEKWIEGGVLQWRGIRGGIREATFKNARSFALEAGFVVTEKGQPRNASYRIEIEIGDQGRPPRVTEERLAIIGRGQFVFDSHPETNAPVQSDPLHLAVRLRKRGGGGWLGPTINFLSSQPVLSQIHDHPAVKLAEVKEHTRLALDAFKSMRFLDLTPEAMRLPSIPGQTILGDRGENLSSVLQAICDDERQKKALVQWVRELTPLDASDFEFVPDQTGRILVSLVEENGYKISAYSASDGTLRFLAMIAALLGPEPARFYFFEELENGIHPTRLHLLLQLIEHKTSTGGIQMVASSHSPQLLGFLSTHAQKSAVLVYRLPRREDAGIRRIMDVPGAARVLREQDLAKLHASGWLEDAVAFAEASTEEHDTPSRQSDLFAGGASPSE